MAFELWENHIHIAEFIVLLTFTPIGIVVTALRFVATHRAARKPSLEDWLAVVATVIFVLVAIASCMAITTLNGRSIAQEIPESPSDYSRMRKWDMIGIYFYLGHSLSVKLSVLAFYYRIFGINSAYRAWIYVIGGTQTILMIGFCIAEAFLCTPLQKYFDRSIPGTCKDDGMVIIAAETPNSFIDFAMVSLAMYMIRGLQLSPAIKWKLRFLFGLGALVGIIGFIKIAITYSTADLYAFSMVALLTCVQMFVSLLCCCLPVYPPILPSVTFWDRLISYATFGRLSLGGDSSNRRNDPSLGSRRQHGWNNLDENNSTKGLTWPKATHQAETYALSDFSIGVAHPNAPGIQVVRQFDVA
ncbi:hypothetical protein F4806DRAFT_471582 [Annulohypoxylon nitens]|nr:hypothetical protein F4806DRAFT_471582 [Annulohypoxylon nitens]